MDCSTRWTSQRGTRPIRIANCSGAKMDPGYQMYRQATQGDVDVITGDYLAEFNLAMNAEAFAAGTHSGWEETAWDGIQQSLEVVAEKNIKIVINGGSINPSGLAEKTRQLAREKGLKLNIGYVEGDNALPEMREMLANTKKLPSHLDPEDDAGIHLAKNARAYLDTENHPLIAANAYLGARAIVAGLKAGADIIICGRVADASPVIGSAWHWHDWSDTDYDRLAGGLVAGHLIECSGYATGSNFSGFTDYPLETFLNIGYPIAEVAADGTCVITKHEGTNGLVNHDTVLCQFLYELQGDIYLHSDVTALLSGVSISDDGPNRVLVTGITGQPPPPTTKLAIFYRGGFESQLLVNATGFGTVRKFALLEAQCRLALSNASIDADTAFETLEFQHVGTPGPDAKTMLASTTYLRIFAQASTLPPLLALIKGYTECGMQHFSGMHGSLDSRTAVPKPYLAFYPAVWPQDRLDERVVVFVDRVGDGERPYVQEVGTRHPPRYQNLAKRHSYDGPALTSLTPTPALSVVDITALTRGPTVAIPLGSIALARSGDKGANLNIGFFPRRSLANGALARAWLRSYLSIARLQELLGDDWRADELFVERVEFEEVAAVHFVVYGWLGRGVCGCSRLDSLGKGAADWVRGRVVEVPRAVAEGAVDEEGSPIDLKAMESAEGGGGRGEARL